MLHIQWIKNKISSQKNCLDKDKAECVGHDGIEGNEGLALPFWGKNDSSH
jgi:hypothetical protein